MLGGASLSLLRRKGPKVDPELNNINKLEQVSKEEVGNLEKKTLTQKTKALQVLFKIQIEQKKKN